MTPTTPLDAVAAEQYVSLTTFRRTGAPVATAVWAAPDGDALVVTTLDSTGKVKRIRHTPRVELRPCSRTGQVAEGAPTVVGTATVHWDPASIAQADEALQRKYKLAYRLFRGVTKLRRAGEAQRVILRIVAV